MNGDRLKFLLAAAADRPLTGVEEHELARLLELPGNLDVADRELTDAKHRLGVLLDYHRARGSTTPPIPAARLKALLASLTEAPIATSASPKVVPFRRWLRPAVAAAAVAACLSLLLWYQKPGSPSGGLYEFGVVSIHSPVRGETANPAPNFGSDWRIVAQENLATLRAWSSAALPKNVNARIWIDEETGKLRAFHRRTDGTTTSAEKTIETGTSIEAQVKRFAAQLANGP